MLRNRLLPSAAVLLFVAAAAPDSQPKSISPAEASARGRALAAEILSQRPAENSRFKGTLQIRSGKRTETFFVEAEVALLEGAWQSQYFASNSAASEKLIVLHSTNGPNHYLYGRSPAPATATPVLSPVSSDEAATDAFAGSDFSLADLGLEFFHWPEQRLLKTEMRRGRSCRVLESVNPLPALGACSKVLAWIDLETDGVVHAEAYDGAGGLLKEFDPKEFKKVRGQWQLEEMEINNSRTGSRSRIEFNLNSV